VFTRTLASGTLVPMPVAHAEGRFTSAEPGRMARLLEDGQVPFRYVSRIGETAVSFPDNPNGAELSIAAVCNRRGNVLALMPHPERAQDLGGVARTVEGEWAEKRDAALARGDADAAGPGLELFVGLARHLGER
jgi:phosphoribosylformylglycinamidine synthase